jgi:putative ABC transport system permease protein
MLTLLFVHAMRLVLRFSIQGLLAILGVAIGVANIILLVSITDLGREQAVGLINDFGGNILIIGPYFEQDSRPFGGAGAVQLSAHMPDEVRHVVSQADEIVAVAAVMLQPAHLSFDGNQAFASVLGVTPAFNILRGREIAAGRWLNNTDLENRARVICLGDTVRLALFGDTEALGQQVEIKGELFTVVGLMEHKGRVALEDFDNRVFVPLTTAQETYGFKGIHGMFASYDPKVGEAQAVEAVWRQLAQLVSDSETAKQAYSVLTIKEAQQLLGSTLDIFRIVLGGIASIALFVAGLGIMNVMLIRVLERRHEIGIRRAVGARTIDIVVQFLFEGMFQALVGGLFGATIGVTGVYVYCAYARWEPFINPLTVLLAILFGATAGVVSSVYPALRAARLDPLETLQRQ